jgi:GT2 family glycosyltransferase
MIIPTISIIIVNYNVREFLINALYSLKKSLVDIEHEIFVVDNDSHDDSVSFVRSEFPDVVVIENKINLGFAKANNIALKEAKGKFILLLNPDTLLSEDTMSEMLRFFNENKSVAVAGCKILNADGTLQLACRRSYPTPWSSFSKLSNLSSLFPKSKLFGKYNLTYLDHNKTYEVEALSGSFMMFRREVYEDIGGLDESFFMYGEDLDWFYRSHKKGWKIYYVHSTQIIHYKGESTKKSNIDVTKVFYEAMHLFVKKHYKSTSLVLPILQIGIFSRSLIAFFAKFWNKYFPLIMDIIFINISIILAEYFRFGKFYNFPEYAYPIYSVTVTIIYITVFVLTDVYRKHKFSISRSLLSVFISFLFVVVIELFFKRFTFTRGTLLLLLILTVILLPGWRFIYRLFEGRKILSLSNYQKSILGLKTLIVGYDISNINLIKNLKKKNKEGFDNIIGILTNENIESYKSDYLIIKNENLNEVINCYKVEQILFSTTKLSYSQILGYIAECENKNVVFKMIPKESELLNETNIINGIDFVQIELNVNNIFNKLFKRMLDLFLSFFLLIFLYPTKIFIQNEQSVTRRLTSKIQNIFFGKLSFVGRLEVGNEHLSRICKLGLTSFAALHSTPNSTKEELQRLDFLYAKNQSFFLDCEILINSIIEGISKNRFII